LLLLLLLPVFLIGWLVDDAAVAGGATSERQFAVPWFYILQFSGATQRPRISTGFDHLSRDVHATQWSVYKNKTLKPSSWAFDVRPEWPVGCSLVVSVQTRSDPKNSNGDPSTCPILLWKYSVMEQTPPHLVDCSTRLQRERKRKNY